MWQTAHRLCSCMTEGMKPDAPDDAVRAPLAARSGGRRVQEVGQEPLAFLLYAVPGMLAVPADVAGLDGCLSLHSTFAASAWLHVPVGSTHYQGQPMSQRAPSVGRHAIDKEHHSRWASAHQPLQPHL